MLQQAVVGKRDQALERRHPRRRRGTELPFWRPTICGRRALGDCVYRGCWRRSRDLFVQWRADGGRRHVLDDRIRRFRGTPADEDAQAPEEDALGGREQGVAPGDGLAQRLVARRRIAGPAGKQREGRRQAVQERRHGQVPQAGGRQLQRQGQPVQAPTDLRHGGRILAVQDDIRSGSAGPLREQNNRWSGRCPALASGSPSGGRSTVPAGRTVAASMGLSVAVPGDRPVFLPIGEDSEAGHGQRWHE